MIEHAAVSVPEKSDDATAIAASSVITRNQGPIEFGRWINKVCSVAAVQTKRTWRATRTDVYLRRGSSLHDSRGLER